MKQNDEYKFGSVEDFMKKWLRPVRADYTSPRQRLG
jgi:hypothetical protein